MINYLRFSINSSKYIIKPILYSISFVFILLYCLLINDINCLYAKDNKKKEKEDKNILYWDIGFAHIQYVEEIIDICENNLNFNVKEKSYKLSNSKKYFNFAPIYSLSGDDGGFGGDAGYGPITVFSKTIKMCIIPFFMNLTYRLTDNKKISPILYIGAKYNIVSGYYVRGSNIGLYSGLGLNINDRISIKAFYDSSVIKIENITTREIIKIQPHFIYTLCLKFDYF